MGDGGTKRPLPDESPKIFESDVPKEQIRIDLDAPINPKQQELLSKIGQDIIYLTTTCRFYNLKTPQILTNILKHCPNVERIKVNFQDVISKRIMEIRSTNANFESFKCPVQLKNLTSFEFQAMITEILDSDHISNTTSQLIFVFYYNIFTEIVANSTGTLKHLNITTNRLAGYLEKLNKDPELTNKLKQLHTLRLDNYVSRLKDQPFNNVPALLQFLSVPSASLEVLHLCGVTWTDLSSFPAMPELRTLSIQADCSDLNINLSREPLPKLNTLILCELNQVFPVYLGFGWPFFNKRQEEIGLEELQWKSWMRNCKLEDVTHVDATGSSKNQAVEQVKVVVYPNKSPFYGNKEQWIDKVVEQLSLPNLNMKSIVADVAGFLEDPYDKNMKNYFAKRISTVMPSFPQQNVLILNSRRQVLKLNRKVSSRETTVSTGQHYEDGD